MTVKVRDDDGGVLFNGTYIGSIRRLPNSMTWKGTSAVNKLRYGPDARNDNFTGSKTRVLNWMESVWEQWERDK